MSRANICRLGLGVAAVALGFTAVSCSGIGAAPRGTPRIEVEVVYEVDDAFTELFTEVDSAALGEILRDAARPHADIGLRFYPVPSENYREGQRRPEHVLTVRADRLDVDRRLALEAGGDEEAEANSVTATVRSIECSVDVRFEKRRSDAPNLVIGESVGSGRASPRRDDPSRPWRLHKHSDEMNDTEITTNMLQKALGEAAKQSLGGLQRPIDRELSMMSAAAATDAE